MTEADAEAAAARVLPCIEIAGRCPCLCHKPGATWTWHETSCRAPMRPSVASAILAAWKQGAEEMRVQAAAWFRDAIEEERIKGGDQRAKYILAYKIAARGIAALKVTE